MGTGGDEGGCKEGEVSVIMNLDDLFWHDTSES